VAAERNLKLALADFKKRRTDHLTAITKMYNATKQASSDVTKWATKASQSVSAALNLAKVGKLTEAKQVADDAAAAAKDLAATAKALADDYQKDITDTYTKDRNLGFADYEKQGLLESQEADFKKGQRDAKDIFDKAVAMGMETLALIRKYELMAEQATQAAGEARKAAGVKEVASDILQGLLTAQKEVLGFAKLITESVAEGTGASSMKNGQGALDRKAAAEYQVRKSAIEKEIIKLKGFSDQAKATANAQTTKIPPELKTKDPYKAALAKMIVAASEATRAFNQFSKEGNVLAEKLGGAQ
jgi:hypothetical protein